MQTVNTAAGTSGSNAETEPVILRKRIGSTTFEVTVRFSSKTKETLEDKILRLIEQEVRDSA